MHINKIKLSNPHKNSPKFCIYKTDPNWIKTLRELSPDVQVNFWRKSTKALNTPIGSWFYFNERRTRNIVGRGALVGYEVLSIKDAWEKYGIGNGVSNLLELKSIAEKVLGVTGENVEIGCIILSEVQFLERGSEFVVSHNDYAPQIVGPKYFKDGQLPEMAASFATPASAPTLAGLEPELKKYFEGKALFSYRIGYERNTEARLACLAHYGYKCVACGTNMQAVYGDIAREFIHVHHLNQIANAGGIREVDPIKNLVPLCPNCHAIAHRREPPFNVEELKKLISNAAKKSNPTLN